MPYIPHSEKEVGEMMEAIGIRSIDELFLDIPEEIRYVEKEAFSGKSEQETVSEIRSILNKNKNLPLFIGAGCYNHYIPAVVRSLASRSEFLTSYTQYQPELSQGFLRALFEYQTFLCELTGMDVCNISMYDWASSLGEAALMSVRIKKDRDTVIIPRSTHPDRKKVLRTYTKGIGLKILEAGYDPTTGQLDLGDLENKADNKTAMIYLESPNFFGCIEEKAQKIGEITKKVDAVFGFGVDPISLSVLRPPGDYGADIVIGDAQSLGNPLALGGSQVGVFACREEYVRDMPGRLIGETTDLVGRQGFVLTLAAREQHIRRQKATSNICTNQALNALAAAIYIATLGPGGLSRLGSLLISKPKKLAERINSIPGFKAPAFKSHHFREFVVRSEKNPRVINEELLKEGIQGGLILDKWYPELGNSTLYCVTERNTEEEISMLIKALEKIGGG